MDAVQSRGGGTILIPEVYECGNIVISGDGVIFHGPGAWLVNARIIVRQGSQGFQIDNLGLLDNRGDRRTYLLDISGRDCSFKDISLVKEPAAGGYQMYIRKNAAHCRFTGLRTRGSNGIFIAGHNHHFSDFELESTLDNAVGGDDAFVVKAPGTQTSNISINNGVVRGYSAVLSIGSEVGTDGADRGGPPAFVRNVSVSNVVAERCARLVFIKPGALIYDYRNGLVDGVSLDNLRLDDPTGYLFVSGLMIVAGRGAVVREVTGRNLSICARARSQGVLPTSGVDISIIDRGAAARIEDIDVQLSFVDPHNGARHGPAAPGYPVDHIARVEKVNPRHGSMANIVLDLAARGSRFGGIYVGAGLDDAVTVKRARLERVAVSPPSSLGGGGIWSDSRIALGDVEVEAIRNGRVGGKALP